MSSVQQFMDFINRAMSIQKIDESKNVREFKQFVEKADRIIELSWSERKRRFDEFGARAKKLKKELRKFNILDALGVGRREHSHTHIISWLLDPTGTHGFRDAFLRAFVEKLGLAELNVEVANVRPFQRSEDGFEVDIVVENPVVFMIIENKITHRAGKPQLSREFRQFNPKDGRKFVPVYLTPFDEEVAPHQEFKLLKYADVVEIIEKLLQICKDEEAKIFLKHYVTKLRELAMSEFRGFGEKSKLYLEYYDVIQDFAQAFDEDKKRLFDAIITGIEEQEWYSKEWDHKRTAVMIQIFKRNWKNERSMGVHYEFWLGKYEAPRGEMRLNFHIENDVGDRDFFAKELSRLAEKELDRLKEFQVKGGAPTFLTTSLNFNEENIVEEAVNKISEVAFLENYVDKIFEKMKEQQQQQ